MITDLFASKKNGTNGAKIRNASSVTDGKGVAEFGKVQAVWTTVTPEWSRTVIEKSNGQNRKHRESRVKLIERALKNGTFRTTHQAIAFDRDGVLIDGQHRLRAIAASGISATMLVVTGLDPIARAATDVGTPRSPADLLSIVGGEEDGILVSKILSSIKNGIFSGASSRMDWEDLDAMRKYFAPGLEWATKTIRSTAQRGRFKSGPIAGALVFAYKRAPEVVDKFYQDLVSGQASIGDPIIPLRMILLSANRLETSNTKSELFYKCLNAIWHRIHGNQVVQLKVNRDAVRFFEEAY